MLNIESGHVVIRYRGSDQKTHGIIFKITGVTDQSTFVEFDVIYLSTLTGGFSPSDDGATSYFLTFEGVGGGAATTPLYTSYAVVRHGGTYQGLNLNNVSKQENMRVGNIWRDPDSILSDFINYSCVTKPSAGNYLIKAQTHFFSAGACQLALIEFQKAVDAIVGVDTTSQYFQLTGDYGSAIVTYANKSTISANGTSNRFEDSANGLGVFSVGKIVGVQGFSNSANNGLFRITAVDGGGAHITVSASLTTESAPADVDMQSQNIQTGDSFFVKDSSGSPDNDSNYTVNSISYNSGTNITTIYVTEEPNSINNNTVAGDIYFYKDKIAMGNYPTCTGTGSMVYVEVAGRVALDGDTYIAAIVAYSSTGYCGGYPGGQPLAAGNRLYNAKDYVQKIEFWKEA